MSEPGSRYMDHDWRPGYPYFEKWFVGDKLVSRDDGKEYTLTGFGDNNWIDLNGEHLPPGNWGDHASHYDNLSAQERAQAKSAEAEVG